ncbi:hypothetical protein [Streptomyces sp. 135]|uniref:hypothetical protein n=1 Tax=Streptomyces sp. 135 TaxID=2838850 RepID=UPI001CC0E9C9|nr:hypothetical protein [Streptomyces sp. 135]
MSRMSRVSRKRVWSGALCCAVALLTVPACSSNGDDGDGAGDGGKARGGGGNGVADLSARKISDKAKQELLDAESVHISMKRTGGDTTAKGSGRDADADSDADSGSDDPASLELTLDRDGNCAGTMKDARGASLDLVKRGDKVWMKPDEAFWKTQAPGGDGKAAAELFKGRYIHGTTGDAMLKDAVGVCDLKELQREMRDADDTDDTKSLKKREPTTVDGIDVVPLTETEDGRKNTMYIAAEGKPRLVKSVKNDDGGERTTTGFTDYGEPVPARTPSPKESVDVAKLKEHLQKA